jgi:flavin reductase (DIM6/NTAB) family NADH-FMN oxidoreductase RutF
MLDAALFRSVLGRFATGVTVVTARDEKERDHGMTVSSFCSLSLEPPFVLICVGHDTVLHGVMRTAPHFAVNVLASGQETLSRRFAEVDEGRFDGLELARGITGCALLAGTVASLECSVVHRYPGGDHSIIVGQVIAAAARDAHPLIHFRGGYGGIDF